jgi:hypothetical protein
MYVETTTNGSWLNLDPRDQINGAIRARGSEAMVRELYRGHGIFDAAFDILLKSNKSKQDFYDFISEREAFFASQLEHYGFKKPRVDAARDELFEDDDDDS